MLSQVSAFAQEFISLLVLYANHCPECTSTDPGKTSTKHAFLGMLIIQLHTPNLSPATLPKF